jgi:hypothetical protein
MFNEKVLRAGKNNARPQTCSMKRYYEAKTMLALKIFFSVEAFTSILI